MVGVRPYHHRRSEGKNPNTRHFVALAIFKVCQSGVDIDSRRTSAALLESHLRGLAGRAHARAWVPDASMAWGLRPAHRGSDGRAARRWVTSGTRGIGLGDPISWRAKIFLSPNPRRRLVAPRASIMECREIAASPTGYDRLTGFRPRGRSGRRHRHPLPPSQAIDRPHRSEIRRPRMRARRRELADAKSVSLRLLSLGLDLRRSIAGHVRSRHDIPLGQNSSASDYNRPPLRPLAMR